MALETTPGVGTKSRIALTRAQTARRRLLADRAARWVVTAGGLSIIASILGILVFILLEVVPLLKPASVEVKGQVATTRPAVGALIDEYQSRAALVHPDGKATVVELSDGQKVTELDLVDLAPDRPVGAVADGAGSNGTDSNPEPTSTAGAVAAAAESSASGAAPAFTGLQVLPTDNAVVGVTSDGRLIARTLVWRAEFGADEQRTLTPEPSARIEVVLDPERRPLGAFAAHLQGESTLGAAAQLADGSLVAFHREAETNAFTGEVEETSERWSLGSVPALTRLVLDELGQHLYAGTAKGELYWWDLTTGSEPEAQKVSAGDSAITALAFLIGDRSLVVGQESGAVSIWFPVRQADDGFRLTRIRDLPARGGAIDAIAASSRNRTFLTQDAAGGMALFFSTSERLLYQGKSPLPGATTLTFAPKGDGALLIGGTQVARLAIENPHPEISWRSLFGKVWYEGYEKPEVVWQSTGGTDDFESKMSLTPLLVGTLKGTFYSLLLAIPLGIFGAMFASQFLNPRLLAWIKPTVEIMAALPSVVLGFLAGLWLAPLLEGLFPSLLLGVVLLPIAVLLAGLAWNALPAHLRNRWPIGIEVLLYAVVLLVAFWLCLEVGPSFEKLAFGGNFSAWLLEATGLRYDQRNAVVVGLAMGFAVIPIIFAISEDAFSNVPRNLVAGSLALGANRWQTVVRVVLPTASPGIFSAIMIGFGRAIGETMIVLMATGNTPILDWSPFNGFRTLSANIAVEIPEAPFGGTLYRVLFLAALLLFVLTFLVNTLAELVRQRLRRRYAQL